MNNNILISGKPVDTVHHVADMLEGYSEIVKAFAKNDPVLKALYKSMKNSHVALKHAECAMEEEAELQRVSLQ